MKYYLGLDNGGTTTKAAIYDTLGKEIAVCSTSTAMINPCPGFAERDMDEMWDANCRVIRGVLEKSGVSAASIAGVGICGHGKGLYLWGKDDNPAMNGIISSDSRAYEYTRKWAAGGTEAKVFELSCQHIMEFQPVALLAWIKDKRPDVYGNIKYVFECKDYVRFRLTGEARAELTDYSGANLLNLHTKNYDDRLLALFGIEEISAALPPLCKATEICGYVTESASSECGLAVGTPVIGGMFDIDACALAVGVTDEENLCMIAGTWSINEYLRKTPVLDGSVKMNSLFTIPEYYLVEESSPTSAGNSEWFIKQLLPEFCAKKKADGESYYDELNAMVSGIAPTEFVPIFLPFILASNVHPNAKGSFIGISANHTRAHLIRSIYEGVAFCHKMHVDRLLKSRDTKPAVIRLAGGAAHSEVWTQIFADVLQLPVETVAVNETGALGCAIAVATAVGDYGTITDAANSMCNISRRVEPDSQKSEIYAEKYKLYCKTIKCMDSLWDDMQNLIEHKNQQLGKEC